jgi:hypothetical protein
LSEEHACGETRPASVDCRRYNIVDNQETKMLSPHEFATLLLVKDAPDQLQLDRAELDTLLERQLVTLEGLASEDKHPQLTADGDTLLQVIARMH